MNELREEICRNLIPNDVIVVTIQYRLGYLGFLAAGGKSSGGNWGIHDQIAALKWVHENIENFGGDPDRITIFGESAGGVSVSLLTYIKQAEPYFQQAIAQSGSAYCYWGLNDRAQLSTRRFLKATGCKTAGDRIGCLRSKSLEELRDAHLREFGLATFTAETFSETNLKGKGHGVFEAMSFLWAPTFDKELLPDDIDVLAEKVKSKPFIIGTTTGESLNWYRPPPKRMLALLMQMWETNEKKPHKPMFLQSDDQLTMRAVNDTVKAAVSIYKNPRRWNAVAQPEVNEFLEGLTKEILHYGAPHAHDLEFLFTRYFPKSMLIPFDEEDKIVRTRICKLWTDFAKHGHPTPTNHKEWPAYESVGIRIQHYSSMLEIILLPIIR